VFFQASLRENSPVIRAKALRAVSICVTMFFILSH